MHRILILYGKCICISPSWSWLVFTNQKITSLLMCPRFIITSVIQLQSRCHQCSFSPVVILWITSNVSPRRRYLHGSWSKKRWASFEFGRAYPPIGGVRRKAEKICPDIYLWHVCSDVCSDLLPLSDDMR